MSLQPSPLINATLAIFMQGGVSISIGGCDNDNTPWLSKAIGCRVAPDLGTVILFAAASHAPELMDALRQTGAIAAVFSQPSTHRTLQLKGKDARIQATQDNDRAFVDAYRDAFVRELLPLGFNERVIRAFLACEPGDVVRISFSPCAAFTQTPGPFAGSPLQAGA